MPTIDLSKYANSAPVRYPPTVYKAPVYQGRASTFSNNNLYYYDNDSKQWMSRRTGYPASFNSSSSLSSSIMKVGAGLTGIALLGDIIAKWGFNYYKEIMEVPSSVVEKAPTSTNVTLSPAKTVPLPESLKDPVNPDSFKFTEDNSPALLAGTMQSAEVVALSIGSLVQILADNHRESMDVKTSQIILNHEYSDRLNTNLEAMVPILYGIMETLNTVMTNSLNGISSAIENQQPVTLETVNTITQVDTSALNEWASLAKSREEFFQTPTEIKDSDGDVISSLSPMELEAQKNASLNKNLDDKNTLSIDPSYFNPIQGLFVLPFSGRSSVFDIDGSVSPVSYRSII